MSKSFHLSQIILALCFLYHFAYLAGHTRYSLQGGTGSPKYLPALERPAMHTDNWGDKVKPSGRLCVDVRSVNQKKKKS